SVDPVRLERDGLGRREDLEGHRRQLGHDEALQQLPVPGQPDAQTPAARADLGACRAEVSRARAAELTPMRVTEAILLTPRLDAHPIALAGDVNRRARYWNVWWTLSVVFMALSILVAVLELLGALGDLGIVLAIIGVGLSMISGPTGASRSSVDQIGEAIVTLVAEVSGSREDIRAAGDRIER